MVFVENTKHKNTRIWIAASYIEDMSRCHQKWHWKVLLIKTQGRHKNLRMIASNIDKKQACLIILAQWFSSSRQVWRVWSLPGTNIVNTSSAKTDSLVLFRKSKSRQCLSKTFPRHFIEASEDRITKRGYGTDANADFKTALGLENTSQQYIEGMWG